MRRPSKRQMRLLVVALVLVIGLFTGTTQSAFRSWWGSIQEAPPGTYRVVEVHDGDTLSVRMNDRIQRVRLIGVDTPELHHPSRPVQCFGEAARRFTSSVAAGQAIRLESDPLSNNRDRYGRLLRYVYLPDGSLLNRRLVAEGYGFAYLSFPFSFSDEFEALEKTAEQTNAGLWGGCEVEFDNGYPTSGAAS